MGSMYCLAGILYIKPPDILGVYWLNKYQLAGLVLQAPQ